MSTSNISTGYGHSMSKQIMFDGDGDNYKIWETRFLAYLQTKGLKGTILSPTPDTNKNKQCYAELVNCIDDKSLSIIMNEAPDDGQGAMKLLKNHYTSSSKQRIMALYVELTSLVKREDEGVTEYIIRAEKSIMSLKQAGETLSDGLAEAMVMKGLTDDFRLFSINIAQISDEITFSDFKKRLKSFEETECVKRTSSITSEKDNFAMKIRDSRFTCYSCGSKGHYARDCRQKQDHQRQKQPWCNYHKSRTHNDAECRSQKDGANVVQDESHTFVMGSEYACDTILNVQIKNGLLVDTGATSHVVTKDILISENSSFNPSAHYMELADGTRMNNIVEKRGDAEFTLIESTGKLVKVVLKDVLYIPSYPHNILSVQAAARFGAEVTFKKGEGKLTHNGITFNIAENNRLYYLQTIDVSEDITNVSRDIREWHKVLGHCNFSDVAELQHVVNGMKIKGKIDPKLNCNTCIEGKFVNTKNRTPDTRAKQPLELIHTDLAGPINVIAKDNFKYAMTFTDDYSNAIFVYFLRNKTDTINATKRFLADCAPYGTVKRIRSDNGTEFMNREFKELLTERGIKHESSCPYSPHQNGTAERHWRTLFEMGRCLLIESGLPKNMWAYAVKVAAYIRNRCFNNRTKQTPYYLLTGSKPDLSKLFVFGSECYAYRHDTSKLDKKAQKGIFVGYDSNSPAYLVYYPDTGKVSKHRLIKVAQVNIDQHTQTDYDSHTDYEQITRRDKNDGIREKTDNHQYNDEDIESNDKSEIEDRIETDETNNHDDNRVYPQRNRTHPKYLDDYVASSLDYCYKIYGAPQTYDEAINSPFTSSWEQAMTEEIDSLKENNTFELIELPEGKHTVGGKWVYTLKENSGGTKSFKARYVAKGYSQTKGIDYQETFSPTANITSVRAMMQIAAQNDLIVHQMDVKTAYLHAPIDEEIYLDQPEGFKIESKDNTPLVYKLNKSLYGLKQSGRNWNKLLHEHLCNDGFKRNDADHCVYKKDEHSGTVLVIIWVDDLIIAASDMTLLNQFKNNMKDSFKMKDLGEISYFLGIDFTREDGKIKMSQERYLKRILEKFDMQDCKPRSTPCELKLNDESYNNEEVDSTHYREMVGSLIYAATSTRPDISWVVSQLSQNLDKPTKEHLTKTKHVFSDSCDIF